MASSVSAILLLMASSTLSACSLRSLSWQKINICRLDLQGFMLSDLTRALVARYFYSLQAVNINQLMLIQQIRKLLSLYISGEYRLVWTTKYLQDLLSTYITLLTWSRRSVVSKKRTQSRVSSLTTRPNPCPRLIIIWKNIAFISFFWSLKNIYLSRRDLQSNYNYGIIS